MIFNDDFDEKMAIAKNSVRFFNDKTLTYTAFFADFGPLDLGLTYKFCVQLQEAMFRAEREHKSVLYVSSRHPHKRSNSGVLLMAYMVRPYY